MPRTREVILGERTYAIAQLPMKKNKEWRDKLEAPFIKLVDSVENVRNVEVETISDIAGILHVAKELVLGCMDILTDLLFAYSPELEADRAYIEDNAYDDQAIEALGVAVMLAFPLGQLMSAVRGPNVTPTSSSLPSTNGASGRRTRTATRTNT